MRADLKRLQRDAESKPSAVSRVTASDARSIAAARKTPLWIWPIAAAVAFGAASLLRPALPPPRVTGPKQLTDDRILRNWDGFSGAQMPMFTDGSRIYFQALDSRGLGALEEVSTEGGESVPLSVPAGQYDLEGISPDGHNLLVSTWGGATLTHFGRCRCLAWNRAASATSPGYGIRKHGRRTGACCTAPSGRTSS